MNTNEVISALTAGAAHPNDHVNMGQSSNDVFPSAVHLAALDETVNTLLPALKQLERSLDRKAALVQERRQGRPHPPDGRGAGHARPGVRRLRRADPPRPGADRVGARRTSGRSRSAAPRPAPASTRTRSSPRASASKLKADSKLKQIAPPADPFEAQANRDALVELSGALKVVAVSLTKIAQDIALMGSGPRAGIGELFLPELQKGSSIMPGKVNPVIPEVVLQVSAQVIGNDTAITIGGMQGQFELNVRIPLIARNLLQSIHLLSTTSVAFAEKCIDGIEANKAGRRRARPARRWRRRPRSTRRSATTRRPRSSRRRPSRACRCAMSRSPRASTPSSTTRRSTYGLIAAGSGAP